MLFCNKGCPQKNGLFLASGNDSGSGDSGWAVHRMRYTRKNSSSSRWSLCPTAVVQWLPWALVLLCGRVVCDQGGGRVRTRVSMDRVSVRSGANAKVMETAELRGLGGNAIRALCREALKKHLVLVSISCDLVFGLGPSALPSRQESDPA